MSRSVTLTCAICWCSAPPVELFRSTKSSLLCGSNVDIVDICVFIIHQIFLLTRDWSKRVTWANIPQLIPQFLKPMDNKHNSLNLAAKIRSDICPWTLSVKANSFPRAKLEENCSLQGTDNVRGQISEHIFAPNEGLLFIYFVMST